MSDQAISMQEISTYRSNEHIRTTIDSKEILHQVFSRKSPTRDLGFHGKLATFSTKDGN